MRRIEQLRNDIIFNTNNEGDERYTPLRCLKFFNDAHRKIQAIIQSTQSDSRHFSKDEKISPAQGQESVYQLPSDCFGASSIISVSFDDRNNYGPSLVPLISEQELAKGAFGYVVRQRSIKVRDNYGHGNNASIILVYNARLPMLSHRIMKIQSVNGLTINPNQDAPLEKEPILNFDDYISIVDDRGMIIESQIKVVDEQGDDRSLQLETALKLDAANYVGKYVTLGEISTTHSPLPDILESLICHYVERRIKGVDKQLAKEKTFVASAGMYEDEIATIRNLFAKVDDDMHDQAVIIDESNYGYFGP